jgi:kinesin family protein 1
MDSEKAAAIRLSGDNILEEHCYFENNEGKVVIQSLPDSVTVGSLQNVQITCHLPVESS